jgi:DNA-directed RNA polymerase subunit RPC12/RpoP
MGWLFTASSPNKAGKRLREKIREKLGISNKTEPAVHMRIKKMRMKFSHKCTRCSKENLVDFAIELAEDGKNVYVQYRDIEKSNHISLVELPCLDMSGKEYGCYRVGDFYNLGENKLAPISNNRLDELGMLIECSYCGENAHFVLAISIVMNRKKQMLLQKDAEDIYSPPIVLLGDDRHGNFNVVTFLNPI